MSKTTTVTVRLDPQVKQDVQEVLDALGITLTQAVTMYFNQISMEKALPYHPHVPNAETEKAIQDALVGKNLHTAENMEDLFAQLAA
jgi:DNA-damage-inducible protein J